jgi:hypothetical protein
MSNEPFALTGTRELRSLGLQGRLAYARLDGDCLILVGEEAGESIIPIAAISQVRIGRDDVKYGPFYEMRLWHGGGPDSLALHVSKQQLGGYADAARAVASAVAKVRGLSQVERGLTAGGALVAPLLMFPVALAAWGAAAFVLGDAPWWGRLLVPLLPTLLFLFLLWRCRARQYPRAVQSLAELDRYLPS